MHFMQLLDSYYIMWVAFCLSQITMDDNDGGCHCTYRLYLLYNVLSAITTDHSYSFSVIAPEVADPVTLHRHTHTFNAVVLMGQEVVVLLISRVITYHSVHKRMETHTYIYTTVAAH